MAISFFFPTLAELMGDTMKVGVRKIWKQPVCPNLSLAGSVLPEINPFWIYEQEGI